MRKTLLLTTVIILVAGLMFAWAGKETGVNSSNSVTNVETPKITIVPNTSIDGLKKEAEIRAMEAEEAKIVRVGGEFPTANSQTVIAEPAIADPAPGNLTNSFTVFGILSLYSSMTNFEAS